MCLLVSGGHSDLVVMRGHGEYVMLGRNRDNAAGEAFDKVPRIQGLGYPGGPVIDRVAKAATAPVKFPRAWLKGSFDFSFSGVKTAVLHAARARGIGSGEDDEQERIVNLAAGFQEAVVDVIVAKTVDAARICQAKSILVAGGVAANTLLREEMKARSPVPVLYPRPLYCTDNATMIAACGYYRLRAGTRHGFDLDLVPNLKLGD